MSSKVLPYKTLTTCRICGCGDLRSLLDLGHQPLANGLLTSPKQQFERYPLEVVICQECLHGQLTVAVEPKLLFGPNYPFLSGVAEGWRKHCQALVNKTAVPGGVVVEIGSNDGALLAMYAEKGMLPIGVDPSATNIADTLRHSIVFSTYLKKSVVNDIKEIVGSKRHRGVDLIVMQNVLAHVDDIHGMVDRVVELMDKDTTLIIEVPMLTNLITYKLFDTVYHEHYSYFTYSSLDALMAKHELTIFLASSIPTHGGSLRVVVRKREVIVPLRVVFAGDYLPPERKIVEGGCMTFQHQLNDLTVSLDNLPCGTIGLGASAKATVTVDTFMLGDRFSAIVDEAPTKIGKWLPCQVPIPIVAPNRITWEHAKQDLFIFSWNNYTSLVEKAKGWGFKGKVWCIRNGGIRSEVV